MRGARSDVVENTALLENYLSQHPELQLAAVCTCGATFPARTIAGHIGGSNRGWTIKAGFKARHAVDGYTVMGA